MIYYIFLVDVLAFCNFQFWPAQLDLCGKIFANHAHRPAGLFWPLGLAYKNGPGFTFMIGQTRLFDMLICYHCGRYVLIDTSLYHVQF